MKGQVGKKVDLAIDFHSLLERLESMVKPDMPKSLGDSEQEGIHGKNFRLRKIRDGMEITIGGPVLFDPFSAELTEQGKKAIQEIGNTLRGHRNKVEIRGHAAEYPQPEDWTFEDAMELSWMRTKAVANELILRGVDPRTLLYSAAGPNEPLNRRDYDAHKRGEGRRVVVLVRQSLIDDYMGQPTASTPLTTPGLESEEPAPSALNESAEPGTSDASDAQPPAEQPAESPPAETVPPPANNAEPAVQP
jgi:outer membrane protein OmpA-like peptidoglycan-associated protein